MLPRFLLVVVAAAVLAPTGFGSGPVLGSKAFPIPTGRYASIGSGWRMKIISVRPNVSPKAAGYGDPPVGTGTFVIKVVLRFVGPGTSNVLRVLERMAVVGVHKIVYATAFACIGNWKPTFGYVQVSSGRTVKGMVCFQDRANDAATMRLYVDRNWVGFYSPPPSLIWFALRQP